MTGRQPDGRERSGWWLALAAVPVLCCAACVSTAGRCEWPAGSLLAADGFVATFQSDPNFGRILAGYGGVFVARSMLWGVVFDGFRPDR